MTDIVERVRAKHFFWLNGASWMMGGQDRDCAEAADEIERLRSEWRDEVEKIRLEICNEVGAELERRHAEIERLRAEGQRLEGVAIMLQGENERLRSKGDGW